MNRKESPVGKFYNNYYREEKKPSQSRFSRFNLDRNQLIIKNMVGGDKVLEIGFGDGKLLFELDKYFNKIYGIDISRVRINRVKDKINSSKKKNIFVKVGDANKKFEFDDCLFDTVIASDVLEHLFDPYHFVKECNRVLKKRGRLIVHVPNVAFFPNRIRLLFGILPQTSKGNGWDGGHLHYFTKSTLKSLLKEYNFKIESIHYGGLLYKLRAWWGSLLCGDILIIGVKK